MKIIKEEIARSRRGSLRESMSSTSALEIEELLRAYSRNAGGLPQNINQLSVLFPILERSGLSEIVDHYRDALTTEGPEAAKMTLEDVKTAILAIRSEG